jgi:peptidoglycan/xylan/chitin deacetylase (PgdA/CDA1 family)
MENQKLVKVKVAKAPLNSAVEWSTGMTFSIPSLALQELGENCFETSDQPYLWNIKQEQLGQIGSAYSEEVKFRSSYTNRAPTSSRLPFSYQKIFPNLRSLVASGIGRVKRRQVKKWANFPEWPLDLTADFLQDLSGEKICSFSDGRTPVVLSHDLDSLEGLQNAVRYFLDIEEAVGARSVNFIVPCGWKIDHDLLRELSQRGHEVGIHGYDHSNVTPFAPADERKKRLAAARPLIEGYQVRGYRAPSLLRTKELLSDLVPLYRYDSSIPTSGGMFPVPNNGCASARPFQLDGIAEIPLTMPRDGSLRFLGHSPAEILKIWIESAESIARSGGIVMLLTHCERRFSGNKAMLKAYSDFLHYIANSKNYYWSTPEEILKKTLWAKNV